MYSSPLLGVTLFSQKDLKTRKVQKNTLPSQFDNAGIPGPLKRDLVHFSGRIDELRNRQRQIREVDLQMSRFIVGQINSNFSEDEYEGEVPDLAQLEKMC